MSNENAVNDAVKSGGSYEIIRDRLLEQSKKLSTKVEKLNEQRIKEFGGSKNEILSKIKIRTENNCVPIDMAQVNGQLLVGYQVSVGMKTSVQVEDVFYLYDLVEEAGNYKLVQSDIKQSFLYDPEFVSAFKTLMTYYKGNQLTQISRKQNSLYLSFQIGSSYSDRKVFKFNIKDEQVKYENDRAHEEFTSGGNFCFDWIETTRKDHVLGNNPHVSILDKVFVETIGGDLSIKIENNTEVGGEIYKEPVEDKMQALEDGKISYAEVGDLILLKVKPYNENDRYFIFNTITEDVIRADSLAKACVELPDNHGVIFPDGYYLTNGVYKFFENESEGLEYFSKIRSPNGEDHLFIFFDPTEQCYVLYPYNLINKAVDNPIHGHGYSVYENGQIMIFRHSDNEVASKIHPLTVWKTPFYSDEYFLEIEKLRNLEERDRFLINIGNAELVSAISELYDIINFSKKEEVSTSIYEGLIKSSQKTIDDYHWLKDDKVQSLDADLRELMATSELIIDEFEKVKSIQRQAESVLNETQEEHDELISRVKLASPDKATEYVVLLGEINQHIGHLISIKSQRYIDVDAIETMKNKIEEVKISVNEKLLNLLQDKKSFDDYFKSIEKIELKMKQVEKVVDVEPLNEELEKVNQNISTINSEINDIEAKDSTITSMILDHVSEVFSKLNQTTAKLKTLRKSFLSKEAKVEFAAQFKLLSQSVSNGIGNADTPDACDHELSNVIGQIEKLEAKFSDFDEYLEEIYVKREEVRGAFESHKQQLVNNIQKRISNLVRAANVNLNSITKKVESFDDLDSLNTYFSSDSSVLKVLSLIENIKEVGGEVQSEEVQSQLNKIKDMSMRSLRDNKDIFKDGGKVMVMGKHDFAVNHAPLDLTILNKDGKMVSHLTSTEYYQEINNDRINELSHLWNSELPSESDEVYRSEYLAYLVLNDAINNSNELSIEKLEEAKKDGTLGKIINGYSSSRYKDSYIKGVHDHDAELFLVPILQAYVGAGSMTLPQKCRSYALALYFSKTDEFINEYKVKAKNANSLRVLLNNVEAWNSLIEEVVSNSKNELPNLNGSDLNTTIEAFLGLLVSSKFEMANNSQELLRGFEGFLKRKSVEIIFDGTYIDYFEDVVLWISSYVNSENKVEFKDFVYEAAALFVQSHGEQKKDKSSVQVVKKEIDLNIKVKGLIGEHRSVEEGSKSITLDGFLDRLKYHHDVFYPSFEAFVELRKEVSESEKEKLCLEDFKSKPLTSFVRNRLISEVYFPMIGDNLAKQIGTVGDTKRSDLMGLLLLISPPGYGKTTLIEYVANKLGLVFVKVNCPSIGHSVTSLDPREATDSTSRKEINKINLSFEMGSNVLLYLDDIQHTNPEFLQKFISLCDGTRRVEGVWEGKTKTYDMRGKRFCVVMAGNPYTETGESFKIPDMLANRADIYNLGDILGGKVDVFKLSYIENSLTSNSVLAPLATRTMEDVYRFVKLARGENIPLDEFDFNYSPAEANEITSVLKHMDSILEVVFSVNMEYIKSAAANDKYRVEPPFKLQGSYRNMNKMTEKLVSAMNSNEITNLIVDHYTGESQTLTSGAESNMLKLKSLMGQLNEHEEERWDMICSEFNKNRKMGGDDADSMQKVAMQLAEMTDILKLVKNNKPKKESKANEEKNNELYLAQLEHLIENIKENQSEEKLIELFSKRIEDMQENFIKIIAEKDKQFAEVFDPMVKYFETALKKHEQKKLESQSKK